MNNILDMSVKELSIYVRTANCLIDADCKTLRDVVKHSEKELLKLRKFGKLSLVDLKEALAAFNLTLREDGRTYLCPHCGHTLLISVNLI